ncbi:MAG: LysR family transcriptional regulator [Rhodospirillaceae bacterium]|nr:LysR family transcriptional regulator [Rhodospirillaceae bacterium]
MPASLDPDLLRTFVAFADTGSFTRAAVLVNRTQSAVSMQMRRLEELVGRPLFEKSGRSVALSAEGTALVTYARRILRLNDEALARFSDTPMLTGTVRVGTPDDYALGLLPTLLGRFVDLYPTVHLEVRCDRTVVLRDLLDRGEMDISILSGEPGEDSSANGVLLAHEPVVWVTSETHLAHEMDPLPLAAFMPPCRIRSAALEAMEQAGRDCRVAFSSHSTMGITAAVRAGLAVAALCESSLWPGLRRLGEAEGFPALPSIPVMLCRSMRQDNAAAVRLAEHILSHSATSMAA